MLDRLQKIPPKQRVIGFAAVLGLATVLLIWQKFIPMRAEINQLEQQIAGLRATIAANEAKIRKLDELKAEVRALRERLKLLTEQLPPESEVSGLLRQIQNLVNQSGLVLKLWKPEKRRTHASGLYEEIPISLELAGGYHNFGVLADRIGKLTRIVNVLDLKMGSAKLEKDGTLNIKINCTAMTFAAVEKKPDAQVPAQKKVP